MWRSVVDWRDEPDESGERARLRLCRVDAHGRLAQRPYERCLRARDARWDLTVDGNRSVLVGVILHATARHLARLDE